MELLKGWAIQPDDEPFELVTPTGAALLAAWRTDETLPAGARLARAGYGIGHRVLRQRPNLLRALLLEADPAPAPAPEDCWVMETNVDDMTPELAGALIPRLLEAGALDATLTPVHMKKQRPGILVSLLCRPEQREALRDVLFRESTTFGVREHAVRRTALERRHESVDTPFGRVRLKIGSWRGRVVTASPEYEDCLRAAEQAGVPLRVVYDAALRARPDGAGAQSATVPSNA